jgi:GAF domain-containing protein
MPRAYAKAGFANLVLLDGDVFRRAAMHHAPAQYAERWRREPTRRRMPGTIPDQVVRAKKAVQIVDLLQGEKASPPAQFGGARTLLGVPMLKDAEVIGIIWIYRQEVRPFTDMQIALVTNFAAQAVIAIENARLLNELRQRTTDLTERTADLTEALEQQTATSEVLQVISSSPGELEPVFTTMLEKAVRICDAKFGTLYLYEEGGLRLVAAHDVPEFFEARGSSPIQPAPGGGLDVAMRTKRTIHISDLAASQSYAERHPRMVEAVELGGIRTVVAVPMLKDDEVIGIIAIHRREVRPFTDKQIALVTNFSAQAVIAIENARLLNELRRRTADLTEALEQQTASAEVLQVISSSAGDLEPVFESLLANATRLCEANFGFLSIYEGEGFFSVGARHSVPPAFPEAAKGTTFRVHPSTPLARAAATKQFAQTLDYAEEQSYKARDPVAVAMVELAGVRSLIVIPMIKENSLVGAISIYRQEVRPFSDKQIALLTNFAAQAVIAIENARLLNELRERTTDLTERTADLTEALEQQTATSEVLQVISGSPGDLEPVFASMLENAVRICGAKFGILWLCEGAGFRCVGLHDVPSAFAEDFQRQPVVYPTIGSSLGVLAETRQVTHVADMAATKTYIDERAPAVVAAVELGGVRTYVHVPMLKESTLVGAITVFRQEVRPFSAKHIALLQNFAAQAVIAIENARLLNELRQRTTDLTERTADLTEALEQQTATSEVLQVVSSSPGDLEPVYASMLENAVRVCDATFGNIYGWDGQTLQLVGTHNTPPAFAEARTGHPFRPDPNVPAGRAITTRSVVHVADLAAERAYIDERHPLFVDAVELGGVRTLLLVPMLRETGGIGVFPLTARKFAPLLINRSNW